MCFVKIRSVCVLSIPSTTKTEKTVYSFDGESPRTSTSTVIHSRLDHDLTEDQVTKKRETRRRIHSGASSYRSRFHSHTLLEDGGGRSTVNQDPEWNLLSGNKKGRFVYLWF